MDIRPLHKGDGVPYCNFACPHLDCANSRCRIEGTTSNPMTNGLCVPHVRLMASQLTTLRTLVEHSAAEIIEAESSGEMYDVGLALRTASSQWGK